MHDITYLVTLALNDRIRQPNHHEPQPLVARRLRDRTTPRRRLHAPAWLAFSLARTR